MYCTNRIAPVIEICWELTGNGVQVMNSECFAAILEIAEGFFCPIQKNALQGIMMQIQVQ